MIDATKWYAKNLRDDRDFQRYAKLIHGLGRSLNERKNRFDKADIIEQSIETYSNGKLKWVDDIGVDHIDEETGDHIEFKFISYGMYTKINNRRKHAEVKLKNWNGNNFGKYLPKTAHYYMLGQENALALIAYDDILPFCHYLDDGIKAKPFKKSEPQKPKLTIVNVDKSFADEWIDKMQQQGKNSTSPSQFEKGMQPLRSSYEQELQQIGKDLALQKKIDDAEIKIKQQITFRSE